MYETSLHFLSPLPPSDRPTLASSFFQVIVLPLYLFLSVRFPPVVFPGVERARIDFFAHELFTIICESVNRVGVLGRCSGALLAHVHLYDEQQIF